MTRKLIAKIASNNLACVYPFIVHQYKLKKQNVLIHNSYSFIFW